MAWLYRRKGSPYWWIGFPKKANRSPRSTGLRYDDPEQTRRANDQLRLAQADERFHGIHRQRWGQWVDEFMRHRYGSHPVNHGRYLNRWKALSAFLSEKGVEYPRELTAQHAWDYVTWRTGSGPRSGGIRSAKKNTALEELKFLRMLMRHAIAMGYAHGSPIEGIRVPRDPQKKKAEITAAHLPAIWKALAKCPEWMRVQFQIGYYTGCRIAETNIPLGCADVKRRLIHFPQTKGDKPFTAPMPKELVPLFSRLKRERGDEARAFTPDCNEHTLSVRWCHFFKELGMPFSFHCLRISFVSRCARSGVPESLAMRLTNHASALVHRTYLRLAAEDLRAAVDAIHHPSLGASEIRGSPKAKRGPRRRPGSGRSAPSPSRS
jgi:hypothetical protein